MTGPVHLDGGGLHGRVVERIGRGIANGQLEPGSVLVVGELERDFGASRTVVREALRVLGAKGMVDARPRRGTVVTPRDHWRLLDADVLRWRFETRVDARFLEELAELRSMVEPAVAGLAATRRTEDDLRVLRTALERLGDSGLVGEPVVAADLTFHRALLRASHNELVLEIEPVIEIGLRARDRLVHARRDFADALPIHRAVLDAVEAGEREAAERAMLELLSRAASDADRALQGDG
jgi:GntR family transcriptional regulator, galactonate operon transcriptional repressor